MSTFDREALAAHLGVRERTVSNWIEAGCPTVEVDGEERFVLDQVEAWCRSRGLTGRAGRPRRNDDASSVSSASSGREASAPSAPSFQAAPAVSRPVEPRSQPISTKDAGQRADAARKIAQARQQEHELAQERGLKDLDLAARIRAATTADEVVRIDLEVAALVAAGAMKYQRGQALRQLLAQAHRALADREAAGTESKALYLVTAQARALALTLDRICNGWRRRWLVEAAALHVAEDMKELPTWDGDMQPVLAALQIDAMGEPTSDAWPARFAPPAAAPALVVPAGGAA